MLVNGEFRLDSAERRSSSGENCPRFDRRTRRQGRVSEAPKDLEAWLALALFEHVFVLRVTYRECSLWSRTYHELCAEHAGHSSEE
jgi:hypothetical protein